MICMVSLTKPLKQTFCFGICFDGIDTFDHRIEYFVQFRSNIFLQINFPCGWHNAQLAYLDCRPIGWTSESFASTNQFDCEKVSFHFAFPKLFHNVFILHAPPKLATPHVENHWSKRLTFILDTVCLETFYSLRWNLIRIITFWASFNFSQLVIY